MTKLLAHVYEKAKELPDYLQDEIASEMIEMIDQELSWNSTFDRSQDQLDRLAERSLLEHLEGETEEKGFDEL